MVLLYGSEKIALENGTVALGMRTLARAASAAADTAADTATGNPVRGGGSGGGEEEDEEEEEEEEEEARLGHGEAEGRDLCDGRGREVGSAGH